MRQRIRATGIMLALSLVVTTLVGVVATRTVVGKTAAIQFVDENNTPYANSTVRVLCFGGSTTATAPLADRLLRTDDTGHVIGPLPDNCNYIAALHELHEQPSGKPDHGPAYWIYAVSWPIGADTLQPTSGVIVLDRSQPFVLFNVVASLAWRPAPGNPYLDQLYDGLREASAYLYDLTEGHMAFGRVRTYTGGRHWNGADFRFSAANNKRPSAFVGGIVPDLIPYSGGSRPTAYAPGAIYLGRYWDGNNAFDAGAGRWDLDEGAHTLIHEWAHYALFLYDEYQDSDGNKTYCTGTNNRTANSDASAMDYHYTTSELWHPITHDSLIEPDACFDTQQWHVHKASDWDTLTEWSNIQSLLGAVPPIPRPDEARSSQPLGIPHLLFDRPVSRIYLPLATGGSGSASPAPEEPTIHLHIEASTLVMTDTLPAQVYLLENSALGDPTRITHQGTAIGEPSGSLLGDIGLLGVGENDRLRVFVNQFTTERAAGNGRFALTSFDADAITLTDDQTITAPESNWQPDLDVYYGLTGELLTEMNVRLRSDVDLTTAPEVQLCVPDADIGCHAHWQQTMTPVSGSSTLWEVTLTPRPDADEIPLYAVLRVHVPDGEEDLVRWVQVTGGVGPAHDDGIAPLRDGPIMVDSTNTLVGPGACNRVIVMPAANAEMLGHSLGLSSTNDQPYRGIVGVPLDIDIIQPYDLCPQPTAGDHTLPVPVTLTMFYDQATIDRLNIPESNLRILHYRRGTESWTDLPNSATGQHEEINWVSSTPIFEDGIYAIGWFE